MDGLSRERKATLPDEEIACSALGTAAWLAAFNHVPPTLNAAD
jgi:hypothetical protein